MLKLSLCSSTFLFERYHAFLNEILDTGKMTFTNHSTVFPSPPSMSQPCTDHVSKTDKTLVATSKQRVSLLRIWYWVETWDWQTFLLSHPQRLQIQSRALCKCFTMKPHSSLSWQFKANQVTKQFSSGAYQFQCIFNLRLSCMPLSLLSSLWYSCLNHLTPVSDVNFD